MTATDGRAAGPATALHRVLEVRELSPSAYLLRFSREELSFEPGQWVHVGIPGSGMRREYTIYSPPAAAALEVLVREIEAGTVSRALRRLRPGDAVEVDGPHGGFALPEEARRAGRNLFIASGTGISPFHCFAESYPGLDYRVLHGVRGRADLFGREAFDPGRFTACISRDGRAPRTAPCFEGRVTAFLAAHPVDPGSRCFLCGNSDMIYEAFAMLMRQGVPRSRISTEVYF